jgi:hypothetical protein
MRGLGLFALLLPLFISAAGCVSTVRVTVQESETLSALSTWDWLPPGSSPRAGVVAPHRDEADLHAELGRLVAEELRSHGYARSADAGFHVIFQLVLEPRRVIVQRPRAPYLLSSMNQSASYWIEGTDEEIRIYESFRLVIAIVDETGRIAWRGVFDRQVDEGKPLSLDRAVAALVARLPAGPDPGAVPAAPGSRVPAPAPPGRASLPDEEVAPCTGLCAGAPTPIPFPPS